MTLFLRHWRRIGLCLGGMAGTAVATFALLTALGVDLLDTSSAERGSASEFVEGALLTANRDRLAVCVSAVDEVDSLANGRASVEAALGDAKETDDWSLARLGDKDPIVDEGCPAPPAVFEPGAYITTSGFGLLVEGVTKVKEASYYRTFVFVVSSERLSETFRAEYPVATQEFLRTSDHVSIPVTLGLYVTEEQLSDEAFMTAWLLVTAGARPASSIGPEHLASQ